MAYDDYTGNSSGDFPAQPRITHLQAETTSTTRNLNPVKKHYPAAMESHFSSRLTFISIFLLLITACGPVITPSAPDTDTPAAPRETSTLVVLPTFTAIPTLPRPTATQTGTSTLAVLSATPSETPVPVATDTPTIGPCGFTWASKSLSDLSEKFKVELEDASLPVEKAYAEAYGENCLYEDGTVAYFAAMETDFYVTFTVTDISNTDTLGNLLEQTLTVIDKFSVKDTPGPNPGHIGITFHAGEQEERLWFEQLKADNARAQGLHGAELYGALSNK